MNDERLQELLGGYFDGTLSDDAKRELERVLGLSAEARREFWEFARMHTLIRELMSAEAAAGGHGAGAAAGSRTVRHSFRRAFLAAAAILLAVGGAWWAWRNAELGTSERSGDPATAGRDAAQGTVFGTVREAGGRDRIVRLSQHGRSTGVRPGNDVRVGDRIETGAGQGLKVDMTDGSRVLLYANSRLTIPESPTASPSLKLESGRLQARVEPRPAGSPLVIFTRQAKVEVKGTRLSLGVEAESTRLEAYEGLVGMTRLSDGKSVDVAAGQYAVAAEGVDLVALALADDALRAAEAEFARLARAGSKKPQYGKVLFDDEFDGTMGNWDVLIGKRGGVASACSGDYAPYARIETDYVCLNPADGILGSCVVLDTQRGADRFVGLRSKKAIEAERFVVEARFGLKARRRPDETKGKTEILLEGIEIAEAQAVPDATGRQRWSSDSRWDYVQMTVHRWEFSPAPEQGQNTLFCRYYAGFPLKLDRQGQIHGGEVAFKNSSFVRPKSKRLLFGICGPDWDMIIDRVTVRELPEESVAEGKGR